MNITAMKHYASSEWNFALDIPKRWNSRPPASSNSPYELIRFALREDGTHVLIPMLAQIPHVLLAANVGTVMGVETNSMQFYPAASLPEQKVHPGLYQRRHGNIDLSTLRGPGFGYRLEEMQRTLPAPAFSAEF